ncbi:MAG: TolC family protein [Deltaproteobacteria bacterium]|nr:TolC family protein [Deltaproteobacteria bacterium]
MKHLPCTSRAKSSAKGLVVAAAFAALAGPARSARADTACTTVDRTTIARCALAASLATRSEQFALQSYEGRRRAAGVLLPSNPAVALGGGYTIDPSVASADRQVLWSVTLSQELEIAGQRGKRLDVVGAERRAQEARLEIVRRETAASAWIAYFDALSAIEEARVAARLGALAGALKTVARGRAQAGVSADVEAQLAESAATRLAQQQMIAEQRVATTSAALAAIVGLDPVQSTLRAEGELLPLSVVDVPSQALVEAAVARRTEIAGAAAEREAYEKRVSMYQRARFPNPTISVSARNDWIGERTFGVGVAFPIPLPSPVGRTYAGEIAEASSLAQRADVEVERLRRAVRLEVATALEVVTSRKKQLDLYRPEQVRENENTLRSIAEELQARRLPIRDALITQQGLIDLIFAHVEARRNLCFASVELARAAGLPLDRGAP